MNAILQAYNDHLITIYYLKHEEDVDTLTE